MHENKIMRLLRESNGYSQEYVGSILGIEQNTYSKLESGQIRLSVDRVRKLAELYSIDPEIFFSKDSTVIHLNKGNGSHSNSGTIENYQNAPPENYYMKLLDEKERLIITLQQEVKDLRKEKEQLLKLLKKVSKL